jgi:hypothetical protein
MHIDKSCKFSKKKNIKLRFMGKSSTVVGLISRLGKWNNLQLKLVCDERPVNGYKTQSY